MIRDGFSNHCPMKPFVICQPLGKFDMFTFLVSHAVGSILFFLQVGQGGEGNEVFGFLVGEHKRGGQFSKGGPN